jgi:hypothetical protein
VGESGSVLVLIYNYKKKEEKIPEKIRVSGGCLERCGRFPYLCLLAVAAKLPARGAEALRRKALDSMISAIGKDKPENTDE